MEDTFFAWLAAKVVQFQRSPFRRFLVNIPKHPKRFLVMVVDFCLLTFALWLSFSLRYNNLYLPSSSEFASILLTAPVIGVLTFFFMGIYKTVTRFMVHSDILRLHLAIILSVFIWGIVSFLTNRYDVIPRSVFLGYMFFSLFLVWIVRWLAAFLLNGTEALPHSAAMMRKEIIIYGAGVTGTQLAEKLSKQPNFIITAFIDDNPALWRRRISGYKIYSRDHISKLIEESNVKEVILALPTASSSERQNILRFLEPYPLAIRTLPAIEDIVSGRISVGDLKYVGVEDLLGRDPVPPNKKLFDHVILGKAVLITGAGGSIGSELSRQIFKACPKTIVLFDISEVSLYVIEQKLLAYQKKLILEKPDLKKSYQNIKIVPIIGSVLDQNRVKRKLALYNIQTIFHAAAYKHVPLVESNPIIGLFNNVWGTKIVADMALETGVERFVLISTDKAVRPTNVMGATKRLAEMYLQALSHKNQKADDTIFTMVRFGNVLDSSGSVVQKFREQITEGGPVTVTSPDIVRYFMSIPEAAELVIQAGAMAKGGEVYILDMGEAVKIIDLATSMIRLMGCEVRNEGNPDGDIEVVFSGLRPGEKLYEELLIEETSQGTAHMRIQRNNEPFLEMTELEKSMMRLEAIIENDDIEKLYKMLEVLVLGYVPSKEIKRLSKR